MANKGSRTSAAVGQWNNFRSQVLERRLMRKFLGCKPCQQSLVWEVFSINKVEVSLGLESDKRPVGFRRPNIGKLDCPFEGSSQPWHHLSLKAIWTRTPPELVNVWAHEPVQGCSCSGTEENDGGCNCSLDDHIHVRWSHECYHRP